MSSSNIAKAIASKNLNQSHKLDHPKIISNLYSSQDPLSAVSSEAKIKILEKIIEINIRNKYESDLLTYNITREQTESLISYMLSEGFDYIIDPVWEKSSGIAYKLEDINKIEDKKLISLNLRFFQ